MAAGRRCEIVVVGGGLVGLATALALPDPGSTVVLEAEERLAAHQSGRNSGVIHTGLYYPPGSLKARLCAEGREALYRFCAERGIPYRRSGKLVIAAREAEVPRLAELERRGRANGLGGIERLAAAGIREREPHAAGIAGLWVPDAGIVDFAAVTRELAAELGRRGGEVRLGWRVTGLRRDGEALVLHTPAGELRARYLVNCAGLQADRVARLAGEDPDLRILPFRGDYRELVPARRHLVRGLIYPVPDPDLPFLGIHLTRTIDGRVEAGPSAVLALARGRYGRLAFSVRDAWDALAFKGFWRFLRGHAATAVREVRRSLVPAAFAATAARLVPEIAASDLISAGCGIRAQAVDRQGRLLDDFRFAAGPRAFHVLNAPSPGATAALAIGGEVAARARSHFDL